MAVSVTDTVEVEALSVVCETDTLVDTLVKEAVVVDVWVASMRKNS